MRGLRADGPFSVLEAVSSEINLGRLVWEALRIELGSQNNL